MNKSPAHIVLHRMLYYAIHKCKCVSDQRKTQLGSSAKLLKVLGDLEGLFGFLSKTVGVDPERKNELKIISENHSTTTRTYLNSKSFEGCIIKIITLRHLRVYYPLHWESQS